MTKAILSRQRPFLCFTNTNNKEVTWHRTNVRLVMHYRQNATLALPYTTIRQHIRTHTHSSHKIASNQLNCVGLDKARMFAMKMSDKKRKHMILMKDIHNRVSLSEFAFE